MVAAVAAAEGEESQEKQTHLDNLGELSSLDVDHVIFKTKKDCALDNYPEVSIEDILDFVSIQIKHFLEVDSAHYPELDVRVASEGQARVDLYTKGQKIDTVHIYKWDIEEIRRLMSDLGLERDESLTWEKRWGKDKLNQYLNSPPSTDSTKEPKKEEPAPGESEEKKDEL